MEQDKPINPPTPALPQPEEMLITPEASPKKTKLTFILLGVFIIFLIGAGTFFVSKSLRRPAVAPQPTPPIQKACTLDAKICPDGSSVGRTGPNCEFAPCPTSKPSDETVNWKTYTNEKYGVVFKYPPNWKFKEWTQKKAYEPYEEYMTEVMLDPKKIPSENDLKTVDIPHGSVSIRMSTENNETIGYQSLKDVKIGVNGSLSGKISEITMGKDSPNGAFEDTHQINYFLSNNGEVFVTIWYISGLDYEHFWISNTNEEYLPIFNQILSTFKFLDETTVPCGGWDTFGDVVCECSGQIEKSTCPSNAVCDSGSDTCYGSCGECKCYNGPAKNGIEIPCNGRDKYFK